MFPMYDRRIYSVYDEPNNITEVILIYSDVYMLYM